MYEMKGQEVAVFFRLVFPIFFVAFLFSCANTTEKQAKKLPSVFITKVQLQQISDILTYPARVHSKINSTILSENNGIISQVLVTLGQKVQARQPLMILSHTDPVYQYAPVRVLAPISGIVSSMDAMQGSHVVVGQALASVINLSQIEIQTEVPAQDLSLIKKGMRGEFKIAGQEQSFQVEVLGTSPFVKPGTGTASAKLKIASSVNQVLSPGIQGQVSFKTHSHQGFLIPDTAIVYRGKNTFIKIVENKKTKQLPVELGSKQRGYVEIIKGLFSGAEVIERSSRSVAEGESVNVELSPSD